MIYLIKLIILIFICFTLNNCGIDGFPTSPSEKKQSDTFNALIPVGKQIQHKSSEQEIKKSYTNINELDILGFDYNANFGLENDELDDVFNRITPPAGQTKVKRVIMSLE
jgi:hypothetical protein